MPVEALVPLEEFCHALSLAETISPQGDILGMPGGTPRIGLTVRGLVGSAQL